MSNGVPPDFVVNQGDGATVRVVHLTGEVSGRYQLCARCGEPVVDTLEEEALSPGRYFGRWPSGTAYHVMDSDPGDPDEDVSGWLTGNEVLCQVKTTRPN